MIHHKAVSRMHTAVVIDFRKNPHLVRLFQNRLPERSFLCRPADRLGGTGNSQEKTHIAMGFPEAYNFQRGQGIEPSGSAAHKSSVTDVICLQQGGGETKTHIRLIRRRNRPMSGKAGGCFRIQVWLNHAKRSFTPVGDTMLQRKTAEAGFQSILRTARNASLGTWTVPNWRILFLPSFCFSRSFFFRVMSPP